jgi:maltose alpha-D-glucosyltransferase/alpha-amylase
MEGPPAISSSESIALLTLSAEWSKLPEDASAIEQLERFILPGYLKRMRWFGGKARKLTAICIEKVLRLIDEEEVFHLLVIRTKYRTGRSEDYLMPVALVPSAEALPEKALVTRSNSGEVIDAIYHEGFRRLILNLMFNSARVRQKNGYLQFERGIELREEDFVSGLQSRVLEAEQSNSSLLYEREGSGYFLKIYRKLFRETNPDVEMVKFLSEKGHFSHIPGFGGTFFWKKAYGQPITFAMMQQKVNAVKDAWSMAGDYLNEFLRNVARDEPAVPAASVEQASLLGQRTGEMHLALSGEKTDPAFVPEPFTDEYTDWLLDKGETLLKLRIRMAKECYSQLDETGKGLAKQFFNHQTTIRDFFARIKSEPLRSLRTRIHGDYHLGQVMYNGSDYVILDFEGEPESSIRDRKIKHSPLKDVAGMLRSFHYAVSAKLYFSTETHELPAEKIETAVSNWYREVTSAYLEAYWKTMQGAAVFQTEQKELDFLLRFHLLEKAVYELGYELNARPAWVKIPLRGVQEVVNKLQPG